MQFDFKKRVNMGFNFGFFGTPEHRVFKYRPRYYDEQKEALKERFGEVDGSADRNGGKPYTPGSIVKGSFRDGKYQQTRPGATRAQKVIGLVGMVLVFVVIIFIARIYSLLW